MKRFFLLTVILSLLSVGLQAQLIEGEDGKYYDHKGKLYSGTYIEYFPSGVVHIEMSVLNGEKNGTTTIYFENGNKNELRIFKNNKMDGTWLPGMRRVTKLLKPITWKV